MTTSGPIPATILTGFLGAGKTTLLNFILNQQHGYKFGIIVNEVGEIGIDDQLVERRDEEVMLMRNGCICCTVRKDLVLAIQQLLARGGFDYLLIETTGIADPGPIAQTFFNFPSLSPYVRLDSIVTVVDAEQIDRQVQEAKVCLDQIAMADFVLLNKIDLVSEAELRRVESSIRGINGHAEIFRTDHSATNLQDLLDMNAFRLDEKLKADPRFLEEGHEHGHDGISSVSFRMPGLFDAFRFQSLLESLALRAKVYRAKGVLAVAGSPRRAVFHGVNNRFTIYWDRLWQKNEIRESQIVLIGKDLPRMSIEQQLQQCVLQELSAERSEASGTNDT